MSLATRPTYDDELLAACELSTWSGERGCCRWCAQPLPPRRTRWCSDYCSTEAAGNHIWGVARWYALRRTRSCERCGGALCKPGVEWVPDPYGPGGRWRRRRSGGVQVHHVLVNANGYMVGCQHHQDTLEVLGHRCHLEAHARLRHELRRQADLQLSLLEHAG